MLGALEIYNALNVAAIQAVVDTYNGSPAIFEDMILPSPPELSTESRTINFYRYTPVNLARDYEQYSYCINCRALNYTQANAIAEAVITEINRKSYPDYFLTCKSMALIPPSDERDNFNVPIEVLIKKR